MPSLDQYCCPACHAIDWFRDGCVIALTDGQVELACGRFQRSDPALAGTTWSCNQCAHEVAVPSSLARALDGIRSATCHDAATA